MNQKITLSSLVTLLANRTGKPKKHCDDFLREFFNTIVDTLESGESVRVKGLGTFKVLKVMERKSVDVNTGQDIEIPSHSKITFVPSKELSEEVNAPFAIFESVEIREDGGAMTPDMKEREEENAYVRAVPDNNHQENISSEKTTEDTTNDSDEAGMEPGGNKHRGSYRFLLGFACGLACAALLCLGAYVLLFEKWSKLDYFKYLGKEEISGLKVIDTVPSKTVASINVEDSINAGEISSFSDAEDKTIEDLAPTRPSDEEKYDTISKTRYLTTMAKEHYGNYNLWPYIYEENKAILGHPDRIRPGTRVIIPSLSKYGVNPSDPEDIMKAKRKGVEIYSRYQ